MVKLEPNRSMQFVPRRSKKRNSKERNQGIDRDISDHLPVVSNLKRYGYIGTFNIQNLRLSDLKADKERRETIQDVFDEMHIVGVQEILAEKTNTTIGKMRVF